MRALDYPTTVTGNELQVRGLAIAAGYTLSQQGAAGLSGLEAGLARFVKYGALSAEQVAALTAQPGAFARRLIED